MQHFHFHEYLEEPHNIFVKPSILGYSVLHTQLILIGSTLTESLGDGRDSQLFPWLSLENLCKV